MHSPLPARSPNSPCLLVAAISGRALAAAARRAGYRPLVADFFRDTDTLALAERAVTLPGDLRSGIDAGRVVETLRLLAGDEPPQAVVLSSGFERQPATVDEIARHFPLAGNGGAVIRRVKDPQRLAADCAELGVPHPELRFDMPDDPDDWVAKTAGAAGGVHVRPAAGETPAPDRYFQRLVRGSSVSALFIGDGSDARIVGFSRQWTSPAPGAPFRYGGATRLRRFSRDAAARIGGWLSALVRRTGLLGLCSADFVGRAGDWQLVEINPRPGATLDIFDSADAPLMEAHLRASRGEAYELPRFGDSMASIISYAPVPVAHFPETIWPDWSVDRQSPGTRLSAGDPVCTVLARGPSAAASREAAIRQARELEHRWTGG